MGETIPEIKTVDLYGESGQVFLFRTFYKDILWAAEENVGKGEYKVEILNQENTFSGLFFEVFGVTSDLKLKKLTSVTVNNESDVLNPTIWSSKYLCFVSGFDQTKIRVTNLSDEAKPSMQINMRTRGVFSDHLSSDGGSKNSFSIGKYVRNCQSNPNKEGYYFINLTSSNKLYSSTKQLKRYLGYGLFGHKYEKKLTVGMGEAAFLSYEDLNSGIVSLSEEDKTQYYLAFKESDLCAYMLKGSLDSFGSINHSKVKCFGLIPEHLEGVHYADLYGED